jgi:hypothetical protein
MTCAHPKRNSRQMANLGVWKKKMGKSYGFDIAPFVACL